MINGNACFVYFNKSWGIPHGSRDPMKEGWLQRPLEPVSLMIAMLRARLDGLTVGDVLSVFPIHFSC